ncbi:unnamed protein product [Trichobilharzia regenti]|nr:unnamed protein product [Trichobilharzia regenti]
MHIDKINGNSQPRPIVKCDILLSNSKLVLSPTLEEIQAAIRILVNCILKCTKSIKKWTYSQTTVCKLNNAQSMFDELLHGCPVNSYFHDSISESKSWYQDVKHDGEIYRLKALLSSWRYTMKMVSFLPEGGIKELRSITEPMEEYSCLWTVKPTDNLLKFMSEFKKPTVMDFEAKFQEYKEIDSKINCIPNTYIVGSIEVHTKSLRSVLKNLLLEHEKAFVQKCTELFVEKLKRIVSTFEKYENTLKRSTSDWNEMPKWMDILQEFSNSEVSFDMDITRAEVR